MLSQNDQERYSVYVVAKVLNVFYIGKGLGEFLRTRHAVSLRGGRAHALEGVFFLGGAYCILVGVFLTHLGAILEVS